MMATVDGPFAMETTYEWVDAGSDATRMVLRNRGQPAGFARIAAPVMERAMRRANEQDLRRLNEEQERAQAEIERLQAALAEIGNDRARDRIFE